MVLVYLPTKLGHLWGFYVGKYTSTMDDLGMVNIYRIVCPKDISHHSILELTKLNQLSYTIDIRRITASRALFELKVTIWL